MQNNKNGWCSSHADRTWLSMWIWCICALGAWWFLQRLKPHGEDWHIVNLPPDNRWPHWEDQSIVNLPPQNCVDWYEDPKCASVFTDLTGIPVPLPCARAFFPACHHFMAKVTLTLFFGRSPHNIRGLYITFCISSWDGTTALLHMRSQLGTQCIDEHRNGANPSRDVISYKNESLQGEMRFWGLWGDFARWLCELA